MRTTFQRGSFVFTSAFTHSPFAQTGESGIDQAIRQSQRIAFDSEIAINIPAIFCPTASTLRSEAALVNQPQTNLFSQRRSVGVQTCVFFATQWLHQVTNVRQPYGVVWHAAILPPDSLLQFCSRFSEAETTAPNCSTAGHPAIARVRNVTR